MLKNIFVYGTLRRDLYREYDDRPGVPLEGLGRIPGIMFNIGAFPGVIPSYNEGGTVIGQVISFSDLDDEGFEKTLKGLDVYEGVPHLYIRDKVSVTMEDGTEVAAHVYYFADADRLSDRSIIPTGDWADVATA